MPIIVPDSSWYKNKSSEKNTLNSCPYANVYKCPRYYESINILGEAGIITSINDDTKKKLDGFWSDTGLLPVIAEEETSISGAPGAWSSFSNFCPEVSFTYLHYYASHLGKYVDEIDSKYGHMIADRENLLNDWRYNWGFMSPCHFIDCSLYEKLRSFNTKNNEIDESIKKHNQITIQQFISQEFSMSDQYNVTGQVGAIGPNSKAENNTFNQVFQQTASNIDLPALAAELTTLRNSMRSQATEIEHDQAVASIGAAEISAKHKDGTAALEHLRSAGKWALDVATKIGTNVAAKAIQSALGL